MNTAVNEHQSTIQKYMKNYSTYIQCKKLIFYMKNNSNLCHILSFKMIGQFVEFKEYNKIYMLTYRKIILKNFDLSQKRIK